MAEDLSKLDLVELLALLEPIPEPPAVSLWPQTIGWLWIALAALACLGYLLFRHLRSRRANAYRRAALSEIEGSGDDPTLLADIIRRAALVAYPRKSVAALHGDAWLSFLDKAYGGREFRDGPGQALGRQIYEPQNDERGSPALSQLAAEWVRTHRPDNGGGAR